MIWYPPGKRPGVPNACGVVGCVMPGISGDTGHSEHEDETGKVISNTNFGKGNEVKGTCGEWVAYQVMNS